MAKFTLPPFVAEPTAAQLNNWKNILENFSANTLTLTSVLPNSMQSDLDMDSNDILNANSVHLNGKVLSTDNTDLTFNGQVVGREGPTGPEGPQGPTGPRGIEGPVGPMGPNGPVGPVGPRGATGPPSSVDQYGTVYQPAVMSTIGSDFKKGKSWIYDPIDGLQEYDYPEDVWNYSRGTDATTVDPTGEVQLISTPDPRYIYENGIPQGVLIEESKTNLLLHSEDFTQSAWNKQRATITADATTAPDGTPTADKFAATTDNNFHQILQAESSLSCTAGDTIVTFSCFLKAGEITGARLFLFGPAFSSPGAGSTFDLSAGTSTTSGSTTSATMEYMRDGWWRCSITATATDTAVGFSPYIRLAGGSFAGNGVDGLYVWGAQAEEGELTSYIPTVSAQVTRAGDSYEYTLAAGFNHEESTFFIDVISYPSDTISGVLTAAASLGERYCFIVRTSDGKIYVALASNSAGYSKFHTIVTAGTGVYKGKIALSLRAGEQILVANGVHQTTFNEAQLPAEPQIMAIGNITYSPHGLGNSRVLAAKYYPRALSQVELEELTK